MRRLWTIGAGAVALTVAAASVVAVAVPLTEGDRARAAIEAFAEGSPGRACALLTADSLGTVDDLARVTGAAGCEALMRAGRSALGPAVPRGRVALGGVSVRGDRATVREAAADVVVPLVRGADGWRVDLLGIPDAAWSLRQSIACGRYHRLAAELGAPPEDLEEALEYLAVLRSAGRLWAADARVIPPPERLRAVHDALVGALDRYVAALGRARGTLARGGEPDDSSLATLGVSLGRAVAQGRLRCGAAA